METDAHVYPARHWFVPLNELDAKEGARLRLADLKPSAAEPLVNEGDSFLVTLESLLIVEQYDRKSDNDLLVRSRLQYGNQPVIEASNLFKNDVPAGIVVDNLLCEYVYFQDSYTKLDRVHLEVEIMELPGDISLNKKIGMGLQMIKDTFGMVLSSFLPFGGVTFDVMQKVNAVRKQKRRIFFSALDLYGDGGEGEARLRYGAYVLFKEPVDGTNYKLHNLQVRQLVPNDKTEPFPYDYSVIKIVKAPVRVGGQRELAINNQKLAATLGSSNGQLDTTVGYPSFKEDSMPDTAQLRNLALFYSLQKQKKAQIVLNEAQTKLYQKLRQQLQAFIQ